MRLLRELQRGVFNAGSQGDPLTWSNSGDMSQASCTSAQASCEHLGIISVECAWSAGSTPVGTLQLQGSVSGANWFNVGAAVAVSGNTGCAQVNDASSAYNYLRVVYTKTSGGGTLTMARAQGKGF